MPEKPILQVINKNHQQLMVLSRVPGIGKGGGPDTPHITLNIASHNTPILHSIPSTFEGSPIITQETGNISALE